MPLAGAGEDMHVDVDQARRDVQARDVDDLECLRRIDLRRHGGDLAVADGHIGDRADLVPGVDDMAAAEQQVVRRLSVARLRSKSKTRRTARVDIVLFLTRQADDGTEQSNRREASSCSLGDTRSSLGPADDGMCPVGLIHSAADVLDPRAPHGPKRTRAMTKARLIVLAPVILALSLAGPARGQAPAKKFITPNGKRPTGLFAPGVMVGKTLYIAGKGDYRPNAPFPEKVKNCLNEIRKTLQMAGLDMKHVVKSFVYLEDHDQYAEFNKHYAKFFPDNPPARTTLGVPQVPGDSRVEITCIAYGDLAETKRIGDPPAGPAVQPRHPGGRYALRLGQGGPAPRRQPPRDLRRAGPAVDAERRDDAQAGRAGLPECRHEPRLPR